MWNRKLNWLRSNTPNTHFFTDPFLFRLRCHGKHSIHRLRYFRWSNSSNYLFVDEATQLRCVILLLQFWINILFYTLFCNIITMKFSKPWLLASSLSFPCVLRQLIKLHLFYWIIYAYIVIPPHFLNNYIHSVCEFSVTPVYNEEFHTVEQTCTKLYLYKQM